MALAHPRQHEGGRRRRAAVAGTAALAVALTGAIAAVSPATAATVDRTVTLVGSLQSELGCSDDWQPECEATLLEPTGTEGVYAGEFALPAGTYEYKFAIDGSWDEAYPAGLTNLPLHLAGDATLRIAFDDTTKLPSVTPLDLAGDLTAADDALVREPVRQPGGDERFYFVLTDRFRNADASNDRGDWDPADGDDREVHGFDPTDKGFYHGGDLRGLIEELDYIEGLGTTAIWLTPSFKNMPVQGIGTDDVSAGYHGYWITDFTQIDPHLGTNEELDELIADAGERGIKIYFDIITNHTADVIDYEPAEYSYVFKDDVPYRDADGTVFDPDDYAGTGDFPELDPAISFPRVPVVREGLEDVKVPAWLNDVTLYHNRGNIEGSQWDHPEATTYGDFFGLDDLMTEHPQVVDGFVDIYRYWVDRGIAGFRIDTVKHVNFEFWEEWTTAIAEHADEDFFTFGEVYSANPSLLAPYVRDTDMSSVLDFAYQSSAQTFASGGNAATLQRLFAGDDLYTTPDSSAYALPTFLGNHDMGRIGFFLRNTPNREKASQLAHSLMYLTRGQPVVYYGDEQGFVGTGGDKDARQTLFASVEPSYVEQPLLDGSPMGSQDRFDTDTVLYEHIAALARTRDEHPALAQGAQIEQHVDRHTYGFSRVDRDERVEYVVVANNGETDAQVDLTTLTPGAQFRSLDWTAPTPPTPPNGPGTPAPVSFADVRPGDRFYEEITSLAGLGIMRGYADGTFKPQRTVSRQAMAAFLHRISAETGPAPACTSAPFRDVPVDHPFCAEIAWLADAGLADGYADGTFAPSRRVSRQAMAAFIARAEGPDTLPACATAPFADVAVGHPFCREIAWMKASGLSTGYLDGTYRPSRGVSRQAVAAFVSRLLEDREGDGGTPGTPGDPGTGWSVTAGADGAISVPVPAQDVVVLRADRTVAPATGLEVEVALAGQALHGVAPVAAHVTDHRYVETSFAYRLVGTDAWTSLGTSDRGEPRVFHDVGDLPDGTLVEYRAVAHDTRGNRAAHSGFGSVGVAVDGVAPEPGEGPGDFEGESVNIPGDHQTELGCEADWDPACPQTQMTERADGVWEYVHEGDLPAGTYMFKIAVDGSWDQNYGADWQLDGPNLEYTHDGGPLEFYFDPVTRYFFTTATHPVMTVPGSYQAEAGCPGDWQPDCLATLLKDLDGDGVFTHTTPALAPADHEAKVAYGMSWDENYGQGGEPDGENYAFATDGALVTFTFDPMTLLLTVD